MRTVFSGESNFNALPISPIQCLSIPELVNPCLISVNQFINESLQPVDPSHSLPFTFSISPDLFPKFSVDFTEVLERKCVEGLSKKEKKLERTHGHRQVLLQGGIE